ncbi:DinB family protein [Longitalea luteola]|uniref:DinB family protein n=1 Tax=Longitalea luteola TaxID=2812563 RepID=UPI001A97B1EA|nr:DinB family protein [Longitalea luteola]
MKKVQASFLLETLQADTRQIMLRLAYLKQLPVSQLTQQPAPGRWSVAQVLEHLNTYGRYYLPKLEQAITHSKTSAADFFTHGWLGGYFTKSMLPKPDGSIPNKMKTFKNHDPLPTVDAVKALQEFEQQEVWLLELLNKAQRVDINRIRIPVSIAPFIKLKMGDVFGFIIAHHQRHFVQIEDIIR